MEKNMRQRIAFALKCKPEEVPEEPEKLKKALEDRRGILKRAKEAKNG